MKVNRLFTLLSSYHPLTDSFKEALKREIIFLTLPKNHLLLEAPKIATHAYFLDSGFAISYTYFEGRKITEDFWKAGQIIVDYKSFIEQSSSLQYLQLMQKSDVLFVSHDSIHQLLELFPEAQRIYRIMMNQCYNDNRERMRDMQRLGASERFKKLLNSYPDIELTVSQDAIASYLGITAQSLSRIKRTQH